jgi:hypothetical protein
VLLLQAMGKVMNGNITVRSIGDAMKLVGVSDSLKKTEHSMRIAERQLEIESGATSQGIEDMYRQLGYIMQALKNSVPEEYLQAAILEAWRLGLGREFVDMTEIPIYQREAEGHEPDMSLLVRDVEEFGRPRTRLELIEGQPVVSVSSDDDVPPE